MKIRSRWLTKIAAFCAVAAGSLLLRTCRKRFVGDALIDRLQDSDDPGSQENFVLCVWHDALLLPTFGMPYCIRRQSCGLVSRHQDGSYLADAMTRLGFVTVRGSSQRGGAEALKHLLTETSGKHIILTPDGPRGPRRQMKPGAVFIGAKTGLRVLPSAFVAQRGWRVRGGWTDMLIPMPFTTVYFVAGEPIAIPADLTRPELEHYRTVVQQAMDRVNEHAEQMIGSQATPIAVEQRKAA